MSNGDLIENKIIDVARQVFMEHGYENASMSQIASKAGITRSALHYYFRTKDKMFQAVYADLIMSFAPQLENIFSDKTPFLSKVEKVLDEYIRILRKYPDLPWFLLREIHRDIQFMRKNVERLGFEKYPKMIGDYLQNEMRKGHLKTVPLPIIFLTFYGQLSFLFVGREIINSFFVKDEEQFQALVIEWKKYILQQIKNLLCYE